MAVGHVRRTDCGNPFLVKRSKVSKKLVKREGCVKLNVNILVSHAVVRKSYMSRARAIETEPLCCT